MIWENYIWALLNRSLISLSYAACKSFGSEMDTNSAWLSLWFRNVIHLHRSIHILIYIGSLPYKWLLKASQREREISLKGYRCTRLLFYLFNWWLFLSPVHLGLGRPHKARYWIQYIHKMHFHIPSHCADHDIHFHAECFHLFKPPDGLEPRCGVRWWQTLDSSSIICGLKDLKM